ncbi:MAG: protein kinase [Polyangiaceae bacterium]
MANLPTEQGPSKRDDRASRPHAAAPFEDERSSTDDVVGDDLPRQLGRYMLLKRIARGGMGEVLLASTMGIEGAERPVIVKIIRREHKKDPNFYARFLDETRVQAQLAHSGVAQVIDAAIDDRTGEPYAVVEHVEGRSLGEVRQRAVQTGHRLSWADAVALAHLIAEGLAHVHERKDAAGRPLAIVHRDLSPQNVMVGFTGEVKIIDFGTARGQNRRCHTVAGVVFAKPGYVAPEVANGDTGDARVDLYALGIMLWELCKGSRFLQGDAQVHLAKVGRNEMDPPKLAHLIGAPLELDAVIAKLTAFDRDARYLAARSAATDLAKLLASAPPLPSGERGVRQRAAHLLGSLFPGEPLASRKEFARLVAAARAMKAAPVPAPRPSAPKAIEMPAKAIEVPAKAVPAKASASAPANDLEGSRFRKIREIGRGASSVVFEVEHVETKKRAALKVLAGEQANDGTAVLRFRRGARALSLLAHENLVRVHDFGTLSDGRPFCAMELCEGETLRDYLVREKGADYREALGIASKILAGLEAAHAAGIVHRDIQPANVFLPSGGGLKLLDFGLAAGRAIALDSAPNGPSGAVVIHGTPEYMAPEQATGAEVDGRADLYAVGCLVFEMCTGRLPFEGPSAVAILDQKRKGSPARPTEIAPSRGIPEAVSEVILKALARHPGQRFQSATEMRKAIDAALTGATKPRKTRRFAGAIAAVTAMLALASGVGFAKSESMRSHLPPRIAAVFVRTPAITPEPARTTDLATVPLGEVQGAEVAQAAAPSPADVPTAEEIQMAEENDPALDDPAEHDDVLAADQLGSGEGETANADVPANEGDTVNADAPAEAEKAAPVKPAHTRHAPRKAAPKPAKADPAAHKDAKDAKDAGNKAHKGDGARPLKDILPPKDDSEDARRKLKKKKVRLAKAPAH